MSAEDLVKPRVVAFLDFGGGFVDASGRLLMGRGVIYAGVGRLRLCAAWGMRLNRVPAVPRTANDERLDEEAGTSEGRWRVRARDTFEALRTSVFAGGCSPSLEPSYID